MDGGSSSVLVQAIAARFSKGRTIRVVSHPKCLKVPFLPCERPVSSVLCVKRRVQIQTATSYSHNVSLQAVEHEQLDMNSRAIREG